MSVSRVEYDAALKRVQKLRCHGGLCDPVYSGCACKLNTLAALGLDEPPTEEGLDLGPDLMEGRRLADDLPGSY